MSRPLPASASVATPQEGDKLHAPSAARNVEPLTQMLRQHAPAMGQALEIASGTGQHIIAYAAALPGLHWQPSEIEPVRRASIDAYVAEAGLENVARAIDLNATQDGWARTLPPQDLILLSNLLHLIPAAEAETLIIQAALALAAEGVLILYGPYKREGILVSDGDRRFDAELRAADPMIGYKDTAEVTGWITSAGLTAPVMQPMPANNLALIARKAAR